MDISLSLGNIKKLLIGILYRFHITIFVVIVVGGLAVVVFLLNGIIVQSGESNGYTSPSNNATFDQTTIDRIKQLKTSSESETPIDLNDGRTNPFIE